MTFLNEVKESINTLLCVEKEHTYPTDGRVKFFSTKNPQNKFGFVECHELQSEVFIHSSRGLELYALTEEGHTNTLPGYRRARSLPRQGETMILCDITLHGGDYRAGTWLIYNEDYLREVFRLMREKPRYRLVERATMGVKHPDRVLFESKQLKDFNIVFNKKEYPVYVCSTYQRVIEKFIPAANKWVGTADPRNM